MYHFLFLTTIIAGGDSFAQVGVPSATPPAQERLVPVPQGTPPVYVADKPVSVDSAKQDVVLQWNEVLLKAIKTDRTPPPRAARNLAIVHAAIYDTVTAIERTHRPFRFDARVDGAASVDAAAAVAAHRTLVELYPRQVEQFDAALDVSLQIVPDGAAKRGGVALGQHVAEKILAWRSEDGGRRQVRYTPRNRTGLWRPTPPGHRAALLPQWRYLTPFAIPGAARFLPGAPPTLNSAEYTEAFREVKELGERKSSTRTAEQNLIAWFWDDGVGSVTPPGHWNQIAQAASRQRGLTPAENAQLFALLNISLADAAILCWEGKFSYSYWRPVTAIHEADLDDNPATTPDSAWQSLLTNPPFPSYPSGHSTFSGAGATALASFFATDAVPFILGSDGAPGVTRTFPGFWAAAQEAGRSRIYGGIHYEFDNREGLRTGRELADYIARHYFRPLEERALTLRGDAGSPSFLPAHRRHFSADITEQTPREPRAPARGR